MELTKQRKVFAAVLVLGAGAVAFDQFVLGYDQPAAASAAEAPAPAATSESAPTPRPAGRDISERLAVAQEGLGGAGVSLSAAFVPPAEWFPRPIVVGVAPVKPAAETGIVGELHLRMLGKGIARVNEHVLRVGESKGGITLVSTDSDQRRAVVRVGDREVTLELPATLEGPKSR